MFLYLMFIIIKADEVNITFCRRFVCPKTLFACFSKTEQVTARSVDLHPLSLHGIMFARCVKFTGCEGFGTQILR